MERLTSNIDFCQMHCDFGRAGGCFFKDKTHCYDNNLYNRLREYEIAEEQGLLLRLPCKVGDVVWDIDCGKPYAYKITGYSFGTAEDYIDEPVKEDEIVYYCTDSTGSITGGFVSSVIGKTVFLTKEEAEQACNCVGHINHNGKFNVCRISGDILKEDDYYKKRPDNCPLRELPQKRRTIGKESENDQLCFNGGYNACIDEILKGAEDNG